MASSSPAAEAYLECPVCSELFRDPKLLPCAHLVCRKCLLTWLNKEGKGAECPLCRAVIFPTGGTHLDAQVEALPTDLAVQSAVDNHSLLNSPNVCGVCDSGRKAASSYCLQCSMKLCQLCSTGHTRIPSCRTHVVEDLSTLTPQQLAEVCHMTCARHADRLVELYCSTHQELICLMCFPTSHRECADVRAIADVAHLKRSELTEIVADLSKEEAQMASQIRASRQNFQTLRKKVHEVFDDLEQVLRGRRQAILDTIETEEKTNKASLLAKERDRTSLKAHTVTIINIAQSAANDALLGMMGKLTSRLTDLKLTMGSRYHNSDSEAVIDVTFDTAELMGLKKTVSALGQVRKDVSSTSSIGSAGSVPFSSLPATVSKSSERTTTPPSYCFFLLGDRVKRVVDSVAGKQDAGEHGTVIDFGADVTVVEWDNTWLKGKHRPQELVLLPSRSSPQFFTD